MIRGLSVVRRILAGCMKYWKRNAHPGEQIMAPLPEARVSQSTVYPSRASTTLVSSTSSKGVIKSNAMTFCSHV